MHNDRKNLKYFIYARKSSESDEKQVQSIDDQVKIMTEMAKSYGIKVIEIFTESKSAKEPGGRIIFEKMMKKIEQGVADAILTWKIDRLSRNPMDSARIQWMLQKETLKSILVPDREYKPEDNVLILSVESSMANQYLRDLSKNVKRGLNSKLEKGWMPGSSPIGYLNTKTEIRGENYIIKDPERFDLVRKMWDMMLTGNYTIASILEIVNNKWGFTTKKTSKRGNEGLARTTIYRIFTNQFYAGIINYGGKTTEGKHPKMITLEEYDAVQIILGREGKKRPQTHEFAFTGCIRCGVCGCFHTAIDKVKLIKATNKVKKFTYYMCTRKKKNVPCDQKSYVEVADLEAQIEQELEKYEIHPLFKDWALEVLREQNDQEIESRTKVYEMQQLSLNKTQSQLDNLTRMRYNELIGDEEFITEKTRLKDELLRIKEKLGNIEERADNWIELTEKTFNFACYARIKFRNGDLQTKKEIFTALGLNRTIKDKKLIIEANKWFVQLQKVSLPVMSDFMKSEPEKTLTNKRQKEAYASFRTVLRERWDLNPRPSACIYLLFT